MRAEHPTTTKFRELAAAHPEWTPAKMRDALGVSRQRVEQLVAITGLRLTPGLRGRRGLSPRARALLAAFQREMETTTTRVNLSRLAVAHGYEASCGGALVSKHLPVESELNRRRHWTGVPYLYEQVITALEGDRTSAILEVLAQAGLTTSSARSIAYGCLRYRPELRRPGPGPGSNQTRRV